jgi:hypothetical protein
MSLCSFQEDVKPTGTSCHVYLNVPKLKTTNYRPTIKALTPLYIIEYIKFGISFVVGKTTRNTQTATSFTRTGRCGKQTVAVIYFPGCQTSAWRRNRGARGALICKRKFRIDSNLHQANITSISTNYVLQPAIKTNCKRPNVFST